MKYDDARTLSQQFQTALPAEAGGTHLGFYLAWMLLNGHGDDALRPEVPELRSRSLTGTAVLFAACDGKLAATELDDLGNFFSTAYYESQYRRDYARVFAADIPETGNQADDFCAVADTWENYDRIAAVLDKRWQQWQAGQPFAALVAPAPAKPSLSLSLEPLEVEEAPPAWIAEAAAAAEETAAAAPAPAARVSDAQALLYAAPPLPHVVLEQMADAISRFLGFEAFAADTSEAPAERPSLHGSRYVAEFPGGWHWLELLAVDERATGARPGWGLGVVVRSRLQKLAQELAAIEAKGEDAPLADTAVIGLDGFWDEPAALARTADGTAYLALAHPDELKAALENFRTQVDKRLKPMLRRFENINGLDKLANTEPLTASPLYSPQRLLQNVAVAAKAGNPRLSAICDEVEALLREQPADARREMGLAYVASQRPG